LILEVKLYKTVKEDKFNLKRVLLLLYIEEGNPVMSMDVKKKK